MVNRRSSIISQAKLAFLLKVFVRKEYTYIFKRKCNFQKVSAEIDCWTRIVQTFLPFKGWTELFECCGDYIIWTTAEMKVIYILGEYTVPGSNGAIIFPNASSWLNLTAHINSPSYSELWEFIQFSCWVFVMSFDYFEYRVCFTSWHSSFFFFLLLYSLRRVY